MRNENKRFVDEFANPHAWLMMAENLHDQAAALYERRSSSSITTRLDGDGRVLKRTRDVDKTVFLLGGFALENAIKTFLVYENPEWVSNGRLSKRLLSHSLTKLQKLSNQIPYKKRYTDILKAFESGLDSRFRYPCAVTIQATTEESRLLDHLWDGYIKVMRAYGKKLVTLLGKGWKGPHAEFGSWTIEGACLGYDVPKLGLHGRRR